MVQLRWLGKKIKNFVNKQVGVEWAIETNLSKNSRYMAYKTNDIDSSDSIGLPVRVCVFSNVS